MTGEAMHVLGLSGGRDSAALAVWMRDHRPDIDVRYFFTDTGKELPEVYDYLGRLEGFLGLFDQPFEGLFVANGQISQDLPIERDFRGFQTFLKTAVANALSSASGIYTDDPKLTHRPFLNAPIVRSVLQSVIDRFFGVLVETRLVAEVALRLLQHLFAPFPVRG